MALRTPSGVHLGRATSGIALLVAAGVLRATTPSLAGPIVIRDEFISDPGFSPSLGRGYSIATNTFQGTCFSPIVNTKPSYNFLYSFEELDEADRRTSGVATATSSGVGVPTIAFDEAPVTVKSATTVTTRHHIKVSMSVESYYASVNEEVSKLGTSPKAILAANDLPGFFDACGVYYTRSLTRRSTYLSIFSYQTATAGRDRAFEAQLKNDITGFGNAVATKAPTPPSTVSTVSGEISVTVSGTGTGPATISGTVIGNITGAVTGSVTADGKSGTVTGTVVATAPGTGTITGTVTGPIADGPASVSLAGVVGTITAPAKLDDQVTSRKTTIRSFGFGLGKAAVTDPTWDGLIAYDLRTFKDAVKVAFKVMQNPNVGIVTSMEVVPWVENLQFQVSYKLPTADEIPDPNAPPAASGTLPAKLKLSRYDQKRILGQNSEFLAELDRSARARLLAIYRAKLCRLDIEKNYKVGAGPGLGPSGDQMIVNRRTMETSDAIKLSTLYNEELSNVKLAGLVGSYEDFAYKRAPQCVDRLLTTGFTLGQYRDIPECVAIEKEFVVASSRAVDDYCMVKFQR